MARDGRRRYLRRFSCLVRDDVLGLLPGAPARPLLPDHPGRLVRMAHKSPKRALASGLDVGQHGRELRGVVRLGSRPLGPAVRRPDRLERGLLGRLRRPLQPLHGARRDLHGAPLRLPRRDVSHIRTTGELCERAARAARTLSLAATVVGAGFLAWTVAVAVDRNDRSLAAPLVVAVLGIAALVLSVLFAMDAAAASRSRRPQLPPRCGSRRCSRASTRG